MTAYLPRDVSGIREQVRLSGPGTNGVAHIVCRVASTHIMIMIKLVLIRCTQGVLFYKKKKRM